MEVNTEEVPHWLNEDTQLDTFTPLIDEDIVQSVNKLTDVYVTEETNESESAEQIEKPCTHSEAVDYLEKLIHNYETQPDVDVMHMSVLRLLKQQNTKKSIASKIQKDIQIFFPATVIENNT